jgi:hypothetical protein
MKGLTPEEFENAPTTVQYIFLAAVSNIPIGDTILNKAIEEHPEYFQEEIEARNKWAKIPQEVHDAYHAELLELQDKYLPVSKGISHWMHNIEEYKEWNKKYDEAREAMIPEERELYNKHYSKYGYDYDKK